MKKNTNKNEQFIWGGLHAFFYNPFIAYFVPDLRNKQILDCGSGKGINGYLIRVTRDLSGATMVGIDINDHYLAFTKKHQIYDKQVKILLPKLPFKDKSIDFLICSEVIEHLTEKDGEKLLKEIDRVCSGRAIITTPNIFFENTPGEDEDVHRSLWQVDDFKKKGYQVYGLGFRVSIKLNDPLLKIKQALYYVFTPVSYIFPQLSGFLLCVKDFDHTIK